MNPLIQMLNRSAASAPVQNGNIMQRAMSAMLSGQSPQDFLKTIPQLGGMDLSNPQALAQQICNSRGINYDEARKQIVNQLGNKR